MPASQHDIDELIAVHQSAKRVRQRNGGKAFDLLSPQFDRAVDLLQRSVANRQQLSSIAQWIFGALKESIEVVPDGPGRRRLVVKNKKLHEEALEVVLHLDEIGKLTYTGKEH